MTDEEKAQIIPTDSGIVGIEYRLYPGGVSCEVTYSTEAGFEESTAFIQASFNEIEIYDRYDLAVKALKEALKEVYRKE